MEKDEILKLKSAEKYVVPQSDYCKAEIWRINAFYIVFEIPLFGGEPIYNGVYHLDQIDLMIMHIENWT